VRAASQEVADLVAAGKQETGTDLHRRITARAEKVPKQILQEHGVVEWAVEMIRDARDL
jgi:hypothetical protein